MIRIWVTFVSTYAHTQAITTLTQNIAINNFKNINDPSAGADDAWALQMVLKAEKEFKSVKVLAITTVAGNTDPINAIKNTYRILADLNRTDVRV